MEAGASPYLAVDVCVTQQGVCVFVCTSAQHLHRTQNGLTPLDEARRRKLEECVVLMDPKAKEEAELKAKEEAERKAKDEAAAKAEVRIRVDI